MEQKNKKNEVKKDVVKSSNNNELIIDGTDLILGRLGSKVSKLLLLGKEIKIVNCNDILIIGNKKDIVKRYKDKLRNRVVKQGPYYSRVPADIVKRSFRNMLPYKTKRGSEALKRLKCYNSVPSTLKSKEKVSFEDTKINYNSVLYFTKIKDLSKILGYEKEK